MRVLHVYKDYYPVIGGIENHIRMLATGQARRGLDVTVLVTHPEAGSDDSEVDGIRLIRARRLATVASTPLSLSLFAVTVARRPVTETKTYGYHRVEILAALVNGALLLLLALYIFFEAYQRFLEPPSSQAFGKA